MTPTSNELGPTSDAESLTRTDPGDEPAPAREQPSRGPPQRVTPRASEAASVYDLRPVKRMRAHGMLLRLLVRLAENPVTGPFVARRFFADARIDGLHHAAADAPMPLGPLVPEARATGESPRPPTGRKADSVALWETVSDFAAAYREGRTDPMAVAERLLHSCAEADSLSAAMRFFVSQHRDDVMAQARLSAQRFAAGTPLGPLDGVPVAVKDELDVAGYRTTVGTRFLGEPAAEQDAEVVARLRRAGALLVGKTNMHEIGIGVTGENPHYGATRNPYDPVRVSGGSSGGSATAVASGLCPVAVGSDGGGSIRIPAALCGVVGLKGTFGRFSAHGSAPLCWSVAHVGPIAATARDAAIAYAVMAGVDEKDPYTAKQPPPSLQGWDLPDLVGVRLGVFRPWFESAAEDVAQVCRGLLDRLVEAGAEIVEVAIPELSLVRSVHLVTIVAEWAASQAPWYDAHRGEYADETRVLLALARRLPAWDYNHAQRLRVRIARHFAQALRGADAILTPTTARTAPHVSRHAARGGALDTGQSEALMRFAQAANITGLPAISVPAGYDADVMPVGLQAMGRPWEENLLLRIANVAERLVPRRPARVRWRLLS